MSRRPALLALACAVATWSCAEEAAPLDAVARVGERLVRWSEVEQALHEQAAEEASALSSPVLSALLDGYLDEVLLESYARTRGWTGEEPVDEMLAAEIAAASISEAEIADAYRARRASFDLPARLRLRQILTVDRASAEEAAARLAAGEDFVSVSRALSEDPNAEAGGLQPLALTAEELPAAFAETILALEVGEISPILEAPHGFHIVQVEQRLPAEVLALEEAREEIRADLERQRGDALMAELLDEARIAIDCLVLDHNLPFSYQGRYPRSTDAGA